MGIGFYLIMIGLAVMLLDWVRGRKNKHIQRGEIKVGNISLNGEIGLFIFTFGILVYLLEERFLVL